MDNRFLRILGRFVSEGIAPQKGVAMDGDRREFGSNDNLGGFVDLESHDRRFHPNGYHEGDRCKLREHIKGIRDNYFSVDNLNPNGMNFNSLLADYGNTADARGNIISDLSGILSAASLSGIITNKESQRLMREFFRLSNMSGVLGDDENNTIHNADNWGRDLVDLMSVMSMLKEATGYQSQRTVNGNANANANQPPREENAQNGQTPHPPVNGGSVDADGFIHIAPARSMRWNSFRNTLVSGFPNARNWNTEIQRATNKGTTAEAINELLDHADNGQYKGLLERYTNFGIQHPTSWAAKFMAAVERTKPGWRGNVQNPTAVNMDSEPIEGETPEQEAARILHGTREEVIASRTNGNTTSAQMFRVSNEVHNAETSAFNASVDESGNTRLAGTTFEGPERISPTSNIYPDDTHCCWKCVMASMARFRGWRVRAQSRNTCPSRFTEDTQQHVMFFRSQIAMGKAYERLHGENNDQITKKLREMVMGDEQRGIKAYPDGTMISRWNGGHCQMLVKRGMGFDVYDPYYYGNVSPSRYELDRLGNIATGVAKDISPRTFEVAIRKAIQMSSSPRGSAERNQWEKWAEDARNHPSELGHDAIACRSGKLIYARVKMAYNSARQANPSLPEKSDDELIREASHKAAESEMSIINGSYIVRPDQPLIKEMFDLMQRY